MSKRFRNQRHWRRKHQRVTVIQFPVKVKKSRLTVRKFNLWLWKAATRTYKASYDRRELFLEFKHTPWRFIEHPKLVTRWLDYARTPFKQWLSKGWRKGFRFKLQMKGRWLYQLRFRMQRKRTLNFLPLTQVPAFQKLFQKSFLARQADSFFSSQSHPRLAIHAQAGSAVLTIRYNQIVADILRFRLWTLRRFSIKPVWTKKLLRFYLNAAKRDIHKLILKSDTSKTRPVQRLLTLLQYSLSSVVYKAFKTLGLAVVLHLIKTNKVWVNGRPIIDPFYTCYPQDFIQLDVFNLFRPPKRNELLKEINALTEKPGKRKQRLVAISLMFSLFKNPVLIRPNFVGNRQYRFKKIMFMLKGWGEVTPKLGAWLLSQVFDRFGFFFDHTGQWWRWHKTSWTKLDDKLAEFMEINDAETMEIDEATNYLFLAYHFETVRSFTVFTAFERELFKAKHLPDISGGGFLKTLGFINLFTVAHYLRLKLTWGNTDFTPGGMFPTFGDNIERVKLTSVSQFLTKAVIDQAVRTQNLAIKTRCEQPLYRGRRTRPFNRREAVITPDYFLFSTVLVSHQQVRPGRRFFLNQDNLRFLLAFS